MAVTVEKNELSVKKNEIDIQENKKEKMWVMYTEVMYI